MSKSKTNKTKKPGASKTKAPPKKTKPAGNGKSPKTGSPAMQGALAAVAAMPVAKTSKLNMFIELLKRPEGATIDDLVAATGWQKHTARACISHALAKKRGYKIVSDKPQGGTRVYKIAEPASDH